jgi:hypothetical protein
MNRVVGVIPVGGNAVRLGLPKSMTKCMIPSGIGNTYTPIADHTVNKMLSAGADCLVFVHGEGFKDDVCEYYNTSYHVDGARTFASTILAAHNLLNGNYSRIIFGMPDTVFESNPYSILAKGRSTVCALFRTNNDELRVDRLDVERKCFHVKSPKTDKNTHRFWGALGFDKLQVDQWVSDNLFTVHSEVGMIINQSKFETFGNDEYHDLGTWDEVRKYWRDNQP